MAFCKILDGAMGSELIRRGLELPEHIWSAGANLTNPELVLEIHKEYVDAGADYITSNTFRTTPRAYSKEGRRKEKGDGKQDAEKRAKESMKIAVEIAKEAAGDSVKVLGSIAPLEDCYFPELFPGKETAITEFHQLGEWFAAAGVDILILETMNSIAETEAGLIALQSFELPLWVSFVLKDDTHLLSGDKLVDALILIQNYPVEMPLLNCNPLHRTENALIHLAENWVGKWGLYPNLGIGEPSPGGRITEYESMGNFLAVMENAIEMGASVVGACCGSSPEHIKNLRSLDPETIEMNI